MEINEKNRMSVEHVASSVKPLDGRQSGTSGQWISLKEIPSYMRGNQTYVLIPRLFGDGTENVVACGGNCRLDGKCGNYCACDVKCHCIEKGKEAAVV